MNRCEPNWNNHTCFNLFLVRIPGRLCLSSTALQKFTAPATRITPKRITLCMNRETGTRPFWPDRNSIPNFGCKDKWKTRPQLSHAQFQCYLLAATNTYSSYSKSDSEYPKDRLLAASHKRFYRKKLASHTKDKAIKKMEKRVAIEFIVQIQLTNCHCNLYPSDSKIGRWTDQG